LNHASGKLASIWNGKGLQGKSGPLAKTDTILGWRRKLAAEAARGPTARSTAARLAACASVRSSIWSDCRIVAAWAPVSERWATSCAAPASRWQLYRTKTTTWKDFIRRHRDVLAGTDVFQGRGAGVAKSGDLLRSIFPSAGHPAGVQRGNHRSSQRSGEI